MSYKIVETINLLKKKIKEMPGNCFFNEPADVMKITDFEDDLEIQLPYSHKIFLNNFNGGFICGSYQAKMIREDRNIDGARWNSIHLFGLEEIRNVYEDKTLMNWKLFEEKFNVYPFVPFCRTLIGELLIFANPLDKNNESPVFDACHEEFPGSWGKLYNNFTELFQTYVRNNGNIETTSYDPPTAAYYIKNT